MIAIVAVVFVGLFLMTSPLNSTSTENTAEQLAALGEAIYNDPYNSTEEHEQLIQLLRAQPPTPFTAPEVSSTVTVSTVDEFLAAIAPDTQIILDPGTYNLWEASDYGTESSSAYYAWGQSNQLELTNVNNLIITASDKSQTLILAQPSDADVLRLRSCSNVSLEGFTLGHLNSSLPYSCSGYALSLTYCTNVSMEYMGLYGCGVIGLYTQLCSNVSISNSDIYDCSSSGISLNETYYSSISSCHLYDIGDTQQSASTLISIVSSGSATVSNCTLTNNYVRDLLWCSASSGVKLLENSFTQNHVSEQAFDIVESQPILNNNAFAYNELLSWFRTDGSSAVDADGNKITEQDLNRIHVTIPKNTGSQTTVHVSTTDEFLAAIAPDTEIVLDAESLNLTDAANYGTSNGSYYYWSEVLNGYELVINQVNNLTIRGNDNDMDKHSIITEPRYANVLHFKYCSNLSVYDLTVGHTQGISTCIGGVIYLNSCESVEIEHCGLFGCGTVGVDVTDSRELTVRNCDIYECSIGGIRIYQTDRMNIEGCTFRDLGGYNGMSGYILAQFQSTNITIDGEPAADRIDYSQPDADMTFAYEGFPLTEFTTSIGKKTSFTVQNVPEATNITLTSSDPNVATVSGDAEHCTIQAVGTGTAYITASTHSNFTDILIHVRESW